jgi:type II secretory pathway component PulM
LGTPEGMFLVYGSLFLPKIVEADAFGLAGDTHPDPAVRSDVIARSEDQLGIPAIHVNGNDGGEVLTIQSVRFAAASL